MSKAKTSKIVHRLFDICRRPSAIYSLSLFILLLPAIQPLLTTSPTCGYDNAFHLWRAVQIGKCLRQGCIYPRWAPDMAHGFGFPLFIFHPPLTAYVAALLNLAGLSWPLAINATFVLGMLLAGCFAFIFARDLFGQPAGLVVAVAYVFAPFQAYDVFNRGSLSESFAWAFPPLVLWAVRRWSLGCHRRFLLLASFGFAGFVLTHNLFAFLFAPLMAGWVLLEGLLARDWRVTGRGVLAGFLGLGLCTFFWLPGLAERGWVQTDRLLGTWVFDYRNNFLDLKQMLAFPRVVDPAFMNDWPPKALGLLPALFALLPLTRWHRLGRPTRWRIALLLTSAVGFAFLTLGISRPLWDRLPLLSYLQFPWRFLGPAAFCCALLAGAAVPPGKSQFPFRHSQPATRYLLAAATTLCLVLGNLGWFYPRHCAPPQDTSIAGMIGWERVTHTLGTTAKGEYLPIWVHQMPEEPALDAAYAAGGPVARLLPKNLPRGTHVLHEDYGAMKATIELDSPVSFRATYLAFYYPGWRVTVDGRPVPVAPSDPNGLITFDVPAGRHTILVQFGETPLRLAADALSLLSLAILISLALSFLLSSDRGRRIAARISHCWSVLRPAPVLLTVATLVFLVALALNLSPSLRGPDEWRWAYAVPGNPTRLWIPGLALLLYLILASVWIRQTTVRDASRWRQWTLLSALVLAVPLIQASLLALGHSDILKPLFYRTVSAGASGVFSVGSTIDDPGSFLRQYPMLMPTFPVHPQRYPPGLPMLFYLARQLLERTPALADAIGFRLRLYQCHDLSLMRLSNATISTAAIQMALPVISGLTLWPLYGLARLAYGRRTAAWAVALYPLVSSFALWSARWEQFYPLLAITGWYFLYLGLTRNRPSATLAAGFILSAASLLNFGILTLLLPMGLFAAFWLLAQPARARGSKSAICNLLAFLAGLASLWVVYQLAFGTGFLDIWRVSMSYHLSLDRTHGMWPVYHLYDFFVFLGIPLALLFPVALACAVRDLLRYVAGRIPRAAWRSPLVRFSAPSRKFAVDTLTLGFALGLLLLDLSGTSRGEVARVWLFLTPVATLVAARGLSCLQPGRRRFVLVTFLLAVQLFTFNAFLRVVTTGLSDPPSRDHRLALDRESPPILHPTSARFSIDGADAIALLGYDIEPETHLPGETLHVTLYWQSLMPLAQPYTVFTHLVGPGGQLVGQQDNMPLRDTVPTTCWIPGEIIADPYDIPISPEATEGDYVLETGFYSLATGERLPVTGPASTHDGRVVLASILIGDR